LGERVINGIHATGTRYTELIPGAKVGSEKDIVVTRDVWIDQEMNVVVLIEGVDPLSGNFRKRLSGIAARDQKSDLFEVPKEYRVRDITPPSVLPDVR